MKVLNQAIIFTVSLFNIQWVVIEWQRTCLWNLVILLAEGTAGGDLTLPELAGRDNLMMIIICITINIMCCLLRLILCQYYSIIVGHNKWLRAQSLMLTCLASGLLWRAGWVLGNEWVDFGWWPFCMKREMNYSVRFISNILLHWKDLIKVISNYHKFWQLYKK